MNKKVKLIIASFIACFLLFSMSSCGNKNKYLDGEVCGEATAEGTNAFSQIRRFYVEQFVYDYNLAKIAEGQPYEEFKEVYDDKFIYDVDTTTLTKIEAGQDNYSQAHYIFTYYERNTAGNLLTSATAVEAYINEHVANPSKYIELVQICSYGQTEKSDNNTEVKYGYFTKVNNTKYDNDTIANVTSVSSRMTSHQKACLVFDTFVDPETGVVIGKTTWKQAFDVGLLYGLFVYPMGWLINVFVSLFGGSGWGQVGAILLTTFIIKIIILLCTFKSQTSTQKMQDIQPEILKIQSKYGPAPSPEDKQRMSMELMGVYQKYGVKPFAPFVSLLITFPVFIAMYRAVMYLGVLRTGNIGGVVLGDILSTYIIGENAFNFVAFIIFIIMAASQIVSMKLPQIMNRSRMSREAKQQQKQTNMMSNIMMIMILVMGFMMPVTMSIYWIASALVGVIQSVVMHHINNGNKNGKYKVKKVERETVKIPQGYKK